MVNTKRVNSAIPKNRKKYQSLFLFSSQNNNSLIGRLVSLYVIKIKRINNVVSPIFKKNAFGFSGVRAIDTLNKASGARLKIPSLIRFIILDFENNTIIIIIAGKPIITKDNLVSIAKPNTK